MATLCIYWGYLRWFCPLICNSIQIELILCICFQVDTGVSYLYVSHLWLRNVNKWVWFMVYLKKKDREEIKDKPGGAWNFTAWDKVRQWHWRKRAKRAIIWMFFPFFVYVCRYLAKRHVKVTKAGVSEWEFSFNSLEKVNTRSRGNGVTNSVCVFVCVCCMHMGVFDRSLNHSNLPSPWAILDYCTVYGIYFSRSRLCIHVCQLMMAAI